MDELDQILWSFAKSVEPTQAQKATAQTSHNYLRHELRTGNMEERIEDCYLSGSYSRHTAIQPLDDVDIIILIAPTKWKPRPFSEFPSPLAVLRTFDNAIRDRYPKSEVWAQRRSIDLKLWKMDLDVVPAISDSAESDRIWIPDAEQEKWIISAPKVHGEAATRVNKARGEMFKPLVKLLKYWNSRLPSTTRLKSFAIETLAVRSLGYWGTPCVPDIAQTGSNLVSALHF